MNVALEGNRSSPIYQFIMSACAEGLEGKPLIVEVYGDNPSDVLDRFTIALRDLRFVLLQHGAKCSESTWRVSEEYLHDVAANPGKYVEQPALLSFDWLRDRLQGSIRAARPPTDQPQAAQ